jgi:rsbT antagonist protein RsbS
MSGAAAALRPRRQTRRVTVHDMSARVSILRQGRYLVASVHTALDDAQMVRFRHDLIEAVGAQRARGVIIDVAALDVLDSFGSRTVRDVVEMARLRGARTVIVGIEPDVALAMVRLGMRPGSLHTAMDVEEGLDLLERSTLRSGTE